MTPALDDDLELELRSLPGVVSVGMRHGEDGDVESVTLLVRDQDPDPVRESALQVVSLYYPRVEVAVELARSGPPGGERAVARVALTRAGFDNHSGTCELELSYAGRSAVGRAGSGPLIGGAAATLDALGDLGFVIPFYVMTVTKIDTASGRPVMVVLRGSTGGDEPIGTARRTRTTLPRPGPRSMRSTAI